MKLSKNKEERERKTWDWKAVILIMASLVNLLQTICTGQFWLLAADIILIFSFVYIIERSVAYKVAQKNGYEKRSIRKDTLIGFYVAVFIWTAKMILMQIDEIELLINRISNSLQF